VINIAGELTFLLSKTYYERTENTSLYKIITFLIECQANNKLFDEIFLAKITFACPMKELMHLPKF